MSAVTERKRETIFKLRVTYVVSASKGNSRLGSGSNVVISQVVVGPVESSAL